MFKSFDLFKKLSFDTIARPTLRGSIISIISLALILNFLFKETSNFVWPKNKKSSIIYQDRNLDDQIKIYLEVYLPNCPCALVSVDQADMLSNHRLNISDTIAKTTVDENGSPTDGPDPNNLEEVAKSLLEGKGCYVHGKVKVAKVPGNIHISFHAFRMLFDRLMQYQPKAAEILSLKHNLVHLNVGRKKVSRQIFSVFGENENTYFEVDLPNYLIEEGSKNFDYFLKLVPHLFSDGIFGDEYLAYQYSLNTRSKPIPANYMPSLTFHYDFSPITMKIEKDRPTFWHFLTQICAVVGGIFVFFKTVNMFVVRLGKEDN